MGAVALLLNSPAPARRLLLEGLSTQPDLLQRGVFVLHVGIFLLRLHALASFRRYLSYLDISEAIARRELRTYSGNAFASIPGTSLNAFL
jgi:hypothetical protein